MKIFNFKHADSLINQTDFMNRNEILKLRRERLEEIVRYAKENSLFFANLYENIGDDFKLENLPPTNRDMLIGNFDNWCTDRSVTTERVNLFMSDKDNIGKLMDDKYLVFTTSGSTGIPCTILFDKYAISICTSIGSSRVFSQSEDRKKYEHSMARTAALFAENGFYFSCSFIRYFKDNYPLVKHNIMTCDIRKPVSDIVEALNKFKPTMLFGYSTMIDLLVAEKEKGNLKINPTVIMPGGEILYDDMREHISKAFNCHVQTCYTCTECGDVAYECKYGHLHVNDDWIIVEAVDQNNNPVPLGTQSSKILITNLFNKICPIIRFEITDRVIMQENECECGSKMPWMTLEGRTDDIIVFNNGRSFAPMVLYSVVKEVAGITKFQLIQQEDDMLELRIFADDRNLRFRQIREKLVTFLHENGVDTDVYLSTRIPKASYITGKYKHIISKNMISK